jgi:glycosyltransferase involved in cell wall biosynthesis
MKINIIFSSNVTSNRARGKYLSALNDIGNTYKKKIDIVINNFLYDDFDSNKISILDISDGILTPPNSYSIFKQIYQKLWVNKKRISYLKKFDGVVCASNAQYQVLKKYVKKVYIIPDLSYYHKRYEKKNKIQKGNVLKFVWDGQSVNFPKVKQLIEKNKELFATPDMSLYIITDEVMTNNNFNIRSYIESLSLNIYFEKWEEETFIDNVKKCDVGIAFIDLKCKNSILKPDNKLVNYLGLGLPAIASKTLAYSLFAKNCPKSVIICNNNQQWIEAFKQFNRKKEEVVVLGEEGRKYVIDNYTEKKLINTWLNVISDLEKGI